MYREATNFLMNELDRRASGVGQQVSSTAGHLRKIAEEMRADDLSRPIAPLADRGAEMLDEFGQYLQRAKGRELFADAERFGRAQPWVLATAGMAIGLAGSRMLKASAARREDASDYDTGSTGAGSYSGSTGYETSPFSGSPSSGGSTAYGSPVSSDAAAGMASSQGVSAASAPYTSDISATSGSAAAGGFDESGTSRITKAAEAERLTKSDGS